MAHANGARDARDLHDVQPGMLDYCQVCGSRNLEPVIDLGHQPLCDSLLTADMLRAPETRYPLALNRCVECTLTQLSYVVDGAEVYHQEYPYKSGVTRELVEYQSAMAADLVQTHGLTDGQLVVDIGANDGTLLKGFQARGLRALGVEPTNIAQHAIAAGIPSIQDFFSESVATRIVEDHGQARLITATNVFAHMAPLGETVRGMLRLLADDGVIVIENHYLGAVLTRNQFDTIYHEHIRTYSLKSLVVLFEQYGMEVVKAEKVARYGGNIRVHVAQRGRRPVHASVDALLAEEIADGLADGATYAAFVERVNENRGRCMEALYAWHADGRHVVGNSAPGRCSTLMNWYGIDRYLMPYLAEQPHSLKKGLYLPGVHLPIVDNGILVEEQPDYVVLMAWHYQDAIVRYLREKGVRSKLVVPLPEFRILDD